MTFRAVDCKIAICRKISTQNTMGKSAEFGNPFGRLVFRGIHLDHHW